MDIKREEERSAARSVPVLAYMSAEWAARLPRREHTWAGGYAVTDAEVISRFEGLRIWQDNRCAMCGQRAPGEPSLTWASPLHLDHDHNAGGGIVRGFLCSSCNCQEGWAPADLEPWVTYRRNPPASLFGLQVRKQKLHNLLVNLRKRRGRPATRSSDLGPQPAADLVRQHNRTIAGVAQRCGLDVTHLYGVLRGELYPSHEVVTRLTAFLGVPVTELFTAAALEYLYETRAGRPASPLAGDVAGDDAYAVDDLGLRATDRPRGRPPRFPRDLPRPLPKPSEPAPRAADELNAYPETEVIERAEDRSENREVADPGD